MLKYHNLVCQQRRKRRPTETEEIAGLKTQREEELALGECDSYTSLPHHPQLNLVPLPFPRLWRGTPPISLLQILQLRYSVPFKSPAKMLRIKDTWSVRIDQRS